MADVISLARGCLSMFRGCFKIFPVTCKRQEKFVHSSIVDEAPLIMKGYDNLVKVNIFYPNKEGGRFDLEYYLHTHMPMAIEKLGPSLKGVSIEHGVSGAQPGTEPAFIVMCNYTFDSVEAFLDAFLPQAEVLQGDIPNYTDIEPVIQYSEVKMSNP